MKSLVNDCPLCSGVSGEAYSSDKNRKFLKCPQCELIFVPRDQLISAESEKHRYDAHENDDQDDHYKSYLNQIVLKILPHLKKDDVGLDFGCGKTTLLASFLLENDFRADSFDVYFKNDPAIWGKKYNFIVLSEVIEHLRDPMKEMRALAALLLPGGKIFLKTKLHPEDKIKFDNWFYKRDITHIQFFQEKSLRHLAANLGLTFTYSLGEDIYLLEPT